MKFFLFILCTLLLTSYSYSQNSITFNKVKYYFGDSLNSSGVIKSIEKIDSNYYLGVDAYSDTLLYTSYVVKTDLYGNKISQSQRFGTDSTAFFIGTGNGMIIDSDSNILLIGDYIWGQWGGFAIKLNKNLDTIWTKLYRFPDSLVNYTYPNPRHLFKAITNTLDGNYMIMGAYFLDSNYYDDDIRPYMIKIDKMGNVLWRKLYPNLLEAFDIAVTNDGGFVFTTSRYGYQNVYICKTDSIGNVIWYTKPSNETHHVSFDITVSGNDIYSIIPYVYYKVGNDLYSFKYGIEVNKMESQTGQVIWSKKFIPLSSVKNPTVHQHHEVKVDNNGNIIIVGTGYAINPDSTTASYKGFILKLNNNGDSLWTHFYDWGNFFQRHAQFNAFVITDDGGILAGGFWNPPYLNYNQGAWLVKTDSMGNAPGMFTVGIEEKNTLIIKKQKPLLYPNPATDNFSLRFEQSPIEDYELSIYSSSGALVKQQQLTAFGNEYRVDIGELKSGVYFVRLESDGEVVFSSKFIKQ